MTDDERGGGPPSGDRPRGDRPRDGRPTGRPPGGRPSGGRSYGGRPSGGRPPGARPSGGPSFRPRPYGDRPYGDRPAGDRPRGNAAPGDRTGGDERSGDRPSGSTTGPTALGPAALGPAALGPAESGPRPTGCTVTGRPEDGPGTIGSAPVARPALVRGEGPPTASPGPSAGSAARPRPMNGGGRTGDGLPASGPSTGPPIARPDGRPGASRPGGGPPFRPRPGPSRPPFARPPEHPGPRRPWQPVVAALAAAGAEGPAPVEALSGDDEIVAGRRPVEEAFAARREARRLLRRPGASRRPRPDRPSRHDAAHPRRRGRGWHHHGHQRLRRSSGRGAGRGAASLGHAGLRSWPWPGSRGEPPFVLVLDHLEDPQNVGTLLRSAEACGVHGVLFPSHGAAPISPAAIKTSAGAVEHLLLVPMGDLPGGLVDLHTRGVRIVGADGDAPLTVREVDMRGPLAIVIGSEGRGLEARVRRRVDVMARIPMRGRVASLNASVAGSVFLFEAATQRWAVPPPPPASLVDAADGAEDAGPADIGCRDGACTAGGRGGASGRPGSPRARPADRARPTTAPTREPATGASDDLLADADAPAIAGRRTTRPAADLTADAAPRPAACGPDDSCATILRRRRRSSIGRAVVL